MRVKEINKDILETKIFTVYESKDDNFFLQKKKQGFLMELSLKELYEKAELVCLDNEVMVEKYGEREILLTMSDPLTMVFGNIHIVVSSK